ncbi:TetR/AcrR family transcriptional regulator [Paenibacillus xylaniclasticus]|uniref:TetR/AcrR family transcriptional regulator n=1 Tax=Paenibacillus xylaniclasticus TaxID=588083 RepID=UPI000FD8A690|nr:MULTISPECIES: TetR/AcrR family transcriptional regulator [Paenibacillus]GFN32946.1 putative HTH-type transcriptional regulator YxaF [Paenibacillus curdlanolyticus]
MDKKTYIIEVATALFQKKGYMGVGLSELLQACDISKGAFYHYFPLGKEQLLVTCLEALGQVIVQDMESIFGGNRSTQEALSVVLDKLIQLYDNEGTIASYTFTSIVSEMGALSENVRSACERVYENYERIIARKLEQEGMSTDEARQHALFIIATLEGGIMLSLTKKTSQPLRMISQQLGRILKTE